MKGMFTHCNTRRWTTGDQHAESQDILLCVLPVTPTLWSRVSSVYSLMYDERAYCFRWSTPSTQRTFYHQTDFKSRTPQCSILVETFSLGWRGGLTDRQTDTLQPWLKGFPCPKQNPTCIHLFLVLDFSTPTSKSLDEDSWQHGRWFYPLTWQKKRQDSWQLISHSSFVVEDLPTAFIQRLEKACHWEKMCSICEVTDISCEECLDL